MLTKESGSILKYNDIKIINVFLFKNNKCQPYIMCPSA